MKDHGQPNEGWRDTECKLRRWALSESSSSEGNKEHNTRTTTNKIAKLKGKNKTGASRYTTKPHVEGYLKKPVLGSAPCTGSWVGAPKLDPTSLPLEAGT